MLRTSQFAHFPHKACGSLEVRTLLVESNYTTNRLREQVLLTAALDCDLARSLDEVEELHGKIAEQDETIQSLMRMLAGGEDEDAPDLMTTEVPPSSPTLSTLLWQEDETSLPTPTLAPATELSNEE